MMAAVILMLIAVILEAAHFAAQLGWPRLEWQQWKQIDAEEWR